MHCLRFITLPVAWLVGGVVYVAAQSALPISASVQQFRDQGGVFQPSAFFKPDTRQSGEALRFAPGAQFLTLDNTGWEDNLRELPHAISLQLPYHQEYITLDLLEATVQTSDFSVVTSASDGREVAYQPGRHFRGTIRGNPRAVAAVSFLQNGVMGLISDEQHGNLVLGRLEMPGNQTGYVLYADRETTVANPLACQVLETGHKAKEPSPAESLQTSACVRVYYESDYELYQNKGSVQATVDYLTGAFNQVAALYANEQISTTLSQVFVWTTPDSYSITSSSSALTQFKSLRTSFNGDIAHLVGIGGNNLGGIAYLDVLCAPSYAYAFSDISTSYSTVPTYSWTVEVLTHEMGHNLGSPHTQSCSWPGGAIDNCFTTEGGCAAGPAPVNGGTIMSYCHLTNYGINFSNGFGPLPGERIRSRVANAACLSGTCTPAGTCNAPAGLTVSNVSTTGATVSWDAVSGASAYNVQWRPVGAGVWAAANNVTSPYAITGLPEGETVEVRVQTVCGSSTSAFGPGVVFITSGSGGGSTCGTPANLIASATSISTANISWNSVPGAVSYQLSYKLNSSSSWGASVSTASTTYALQGLTAATTYNVRVAAVCANGVSAYTSATFTTAASGGGSCGNPTNLSAASITTSSAMISWTSVSGANYYQFWYKQASSVTWSTGVSVSGTVYALSNLAAGTAYQVRVRAYCIAGGSSYVSTSFTTLSSGGGGSSCGTPANFNLISASANAATISWTPVQGASGYELQIKASTSSFWMTFSNLLATVVQISNLQPGRTYQARVRTRCAATYSAYTAILNINTPANATGPGSTEALSGEAVVFLDLPSEIPANNKSLSAQAYPNPTAGLITLVPDAGEAYATNMTVQWFDINGKALALEGLLLADGAQQFDLAPYPAGLYWVRVLVPGHTPVLQRVVKN